MPRHSRLIHPVQPVRIQVQDNAAELLQGMGRLPSRGKIFLRRLYCDSTIALPLIVTAVAQESNDFLPLRARPEMKELRSKPGKRRVHRERKSPRK